MSATVAQLRTGGLTLVVSQITATSSETQYSQPWENMFNLISDLTSTESDRTALISSPKQSAKVKESVSYVETPLVNPSRIPERHRQWFDSD